MVHSLDEVGRFTDVELVSQLEGLVRADRALSAKLLVHLGEVDARKLYCERSFSTMFAYCRGALGMSEGEANLRILAARVGRRFPLVLERFGAGTVHLTAIKLLAPLLTQENHVQLLDRVRGMTKRQIEVLVADLAPKPDAPARVRKLPEPRGLFESKVAAGIPEPRGAAVMATAAPISMLASGTASASERLQPSAANVAPSVPASTFSRQSPPRARGASTPLGLGRFKLQVTLGQEAQVALDQLVELFRHQNPSGDITSIVERALFELLKSKMKQRFGHANASKSRGKREPAPAEPNVAATGQSAEIEPKTTSKVHPSNSRHVPLRVRNKVHVRDNGQCTYVSVEGRRCTERGFLEVHHHNTTFARGGEATVENLRLMCRAHNQLLAQDDYGRAFMQRKLRNARERDSKAQSLF